MMKIALRWSALAVLAAFAGMQATAQSADDYRGGWRTESGEPHTYEFSIKGDVVRGIYCTNCSDATTLAFVDGKFSPAGLEFTVTHVKDDGSTESQERATARFDQGKLIVTVMGDAKNPQPYERTLIKDPRGPAPLPVIVSRLPKQPPVPARTTRSPGTGAFAPQAADYEQPGPWLLNVTEKDVVGVWIGFRVGVDKQYFIIRRVGDKLRGMVCGRCDNPYTMAALDDFAFRRGVVTFNILHEDWGDGELPTFAKHVMCNVGGNELRCQTSADHQGGTRSRPFSLIGPITAEGTKGNR